MKGQYTDTLSKKAESVRQEPDKEESKQKMTAANIIGFTVGFLVFSVLGVMLGSALAK